MGLVGILAVNGTCSSSMFWVIELLPTCIGQAACLGNDPRSGFELMRRNSTIFSVEIYGLYREKSAVWHFPSPSKSTVVAQEYYSPRTHALHPSVRLTFPCKPPKMST